MTQDTDRMIEIFDVFEKEMRRYFIDPGQANVIRNCRFDLIGLADARINFLKNQEFVEY